MSYRITAVIFGLLIALTPFAAFAQESSQLVVGQANVMMLNAGETARFTYTLAQPGHITFDFFGASAAPTLSISRDGEILEQIQLPDGQTALTSSLVLDPGTYLWDVGAAQTAANVMLAITAEVAVPSTPLEVSVMLSDVVDPGRPAARYTFVLLNEPSYLYIDSENLERGIFARLTRMTGSGTPADEAASITALPLGTRLRLPAGTDAYRLEVLTTGEEFPQPFTLCLVPVVAGYCGGAADSGVWAGTEPAGTGESTDSGMPSAVPTLISNSGLPLPTPTPALIIPQPTVIGGGGLLLPTATPALIIPQPTVIGGGSLPLPTPTMSLINPGGLPLATPGT